MAAWVRAGNVGERLRQVREALDLTQEAFGVMMGVSDQTVSDYETGRSAPAQSRLGRLAGVLQIPVSAFAEGGPMPATLPIRPPAPRTPGDPRDSRPEDVARLQALLARLAFFKNQLKAYRDLGERPGAAVIAEWLELLADIEEAKGA